MSWSDDGGFSLPELLVSLAIMGLVLGGVFGVLRTGLMAYGWGAARVDAQQSARVALDRMARELRGAGYDPTGAGLAPIAAAAPASITFQKDAGSHGVAQPAKVTFVLRPGDTVLAFTDGIPEAVDAAGELFGPDRLMEAVAKSDGSAQGACDAVMNATLAFLGGRPFGDDVTITCLAKQAE